MELLLSLFESGLFQVRVKFTVFTQLKKGAKKSSFSIKMFGVLQPASCIMSNILNITYPQAHKLSLQV